MPATAPDAWRARSRKPSRQDSNRKAARKQAVWKVRGSGLPGPLYCCVRGGLWSGEPCAQGFGAGEVVGADDVVGEQLRAASPATFLRPQVRNRPPAVIRLIVPNGCSAAHRRSRIRLGSDLMRALIRSSAFLVQVTGDEAALSRRAAGLERAAGAPPAGGREESSALSSFALESPT